MAEASSTTSPGGATLVSRSSTNTTAVWNNLPPFDECAQLCTTLSYLHRIPEKSRQLCCDDGTQTLPDAPRIPASSSQVVSHCIADIDTSIMDRLGDKLWWSGPSNMAIRSLSEHNTLERKIQVTEDATLHCVWTDHIIFMKPLPLYLCSHAFWEYLLDSSNDNINPEEREKLKTMGLGFLKSYAMLIRHRSDFNLARRQHLLDSFDGISFEAFVRFIKAFDDLPDGAINLRWRFGELNLDTLNFYSAIKLHKWHRNRFESRYGAFFERFFPVILFCFAMMSVILSAMQVIVGGRQLWDTENNGFKRTLRAFEWFGTEAIGWSCAFGLIFVVWWLGICLADGIRQHKTKKGLKQKLAPEKHETA